MAIKKYVTELELFQLIDSIGEGLFGPLHIINNTPDIKTKVGDCTYRVYHADGYCFDVISEVEEIGEDENDIEINYSLYAEYDGFRKVTLKKAYNLIKSIKINNF